MPYIWEEVTKISDISCEETKEDLVYNLPNMTENENYKIIGKKFNWEQLYGKLENGKYEFIVSVEDIIFSYIKIRFNIEEDGKITYEEPILE